MRRNFIAVLGFCLCFYFSYNILLGERSIVRLYDAHYELLQAQTEYSTLHDQRLALENKVVRLRPGSLDRDLLEERARTVLGFHYPGEQIYVSAN